MLHLQEVVEETAKEKSITGRPVQEKTSAVVKGRKEGCGVCSLKGKQQAMGSAAR